MIRKLGLTITENRVLFASKSEGFKVTAQAINLMSDKIDELVREVNELETKLDNHKCPLPPPTPSGLEK